MNAGQKLAPPDASDAPAAKPQNFFSRLMGVIFSSGGAFAEIGRAPRVFAPLLSLVLLGAAVHFVLANRLGYENIIRKEADMQIQLMSRMNVSGDRIDEVKKQTEEQLKPENLTKTKLQRVTIAGLMFPIVALLVAGVFKLVTLIMGASRDLVFHCQLYGLKQPASEVGLQRSGRSQSQKSRVGMRFH
jgi:hypothetical protein